MPRKPPGLFITGSDTGVGKTYVAALIARALRKQGHAVGVYKPVASGCRQNGKTLVCEDAALLWEAAGEPGELARVCPQMFSAPLAPNLAAAKEGRIVDAKLLRTGIRFWQKRSEIVLVEGAGGLMSPLTDNEYNADLAYDLGYALLVVLPNRLGVINQALMTLIAAATFKEGLAIAGVVLNQTPPENGLDVSIESNAGELSRLCVPPILAEVRLGQQLDPANGIDWLRLAQAVYEK
jgi:dethiobiotin synthetase